MHAPVQIFDISSDGALHQGEILLNVKQYVANSSKNSKVEFTELVHPYCVVLSQECDLDWDFRARQEGEDTSPKLLPNVLCCMAAEENDIRQAKGLKSDIWRRVKSNKDERFQYLETVQMTWIRKGTVFLRLFSISSRTSLFQHQISTLNWKVVPYNFAD